MKILFLDADGTLFHHEGYIPQSAIDACQKAQENGHKICLCTGRQRAELYGDLLKIDYDGLITGSGGHIEAHGKLLKECTFTHEQLQTILEFSHAHHVPVICESSQGLFGTPLAKEKIDSMLEEQCSHLSGDELENHGLYNVWKLMKVVDDPESYQINKISFLESDLSYQEVASHFEDDFDIVPATFEPFGKQSGEISSKTITKATGMDVLIDYYQMNKEDVIAIGDGYNDLCMFENAHISIAMENADDGVKEKADRVTTSIMNHGVYNAFKDLGLL